MLFHPVFQRVRPAALILIASLFLPCIGGLTSPRAAHASFMIPPTPIRPKDFAIVKREGLYHLFYIRHNMQLPDSSTEKDFGHAVSSDLYHWSQLPTVIQAEDGTQFDAHVWAPSIVQQGGLYWMLFTGVSTQPGDNLTQRTFRAYSQDLVEWRVYSDPVFTAESVPWAWWAPPSPRPSFRDPFVRPDPANPSGWLMYYTGTLSSDTTGTVVGVARSTGPLDAWTDVKPLMITHQSLTFNALTESPHVFQHDGLWYLFITTSSGQPLTFYTSNDPIGDPAAWTYRGRLRNMLGYDTSFWYASEVLEDGTHRYFAFVSGDRIEVREIAWTGGWQFFLVQPSLFHVIDMKWQVPSARDRDTVGLVVQAVNPLGGLAYVEATAVNAQGIETPIPLDSLGLQGPLPLTGDTTIVPIVARRFPFTNDTTSTALLRLRMTDGTAQTPALLVTPPPPDTTPPPPPPPPPPGEDPVDPGTEGPGNGRLPIIVRAISSSPLGDGPALVLTLRRAERLRIDLFDLQGRRLCNLADREFPAGVTVVPWDGRDDAGVRVGPGVSFVRVTAPSQTVTTRVLVTPR